MCKTHAGPHYERFKLTEMQKNQMLAKELM